MLMAMSPRPAAVVEIPLAALEANPFNVRVGGEDAALVALAESIRHHGLLHPILVRPHPDPARFGQYQVVCGERRWRAWQLLAAEDPDGRAAMPARVEKLDDEAMLGAIVEENAARTDWTHFERAAFFRNVYASGQFPSLRRMAAATGLGLTTLHRYLRIFDLPERWIRAFRDGQLGPAQMEVLVEADPAVRDELGRMLLEHPLGKADARRLAARLAGPLPSDWVEDVTAKVADDTALRLRRTGDDHLHVELSAADPAELAARLRRLLAALPDA